MAEIILNGQSVKTEAADMKDLKRQTYASEGLSEDIQRHCVWIVEGFQTDENLSLKDGMTINWIQKGKMPDREEMESMLCARHTPHVYEKAKKARVAIAGLGGLGSNIAIMLARTGIGHLHLIDFDIVEPSNLNRQQYMVEHGILEQPKVDAALAYHVGPGQLPIGLFMYNAGSTMMFSNNDLHIRVKGRGGHGAMPQNCVDPISVGSHIVVALQEIISREMNPKASCVITIGSFHAGTTLNVIPEEAILDGTLRADTKEAQKQLVKRVREVAEATARVYGAEAEVEITDGAPPLICDKEATEEFVGYMRELAIPGTMEQPDVAASASEDFACIAEQVPSAFMYVSAGFMDERGVASAHNPKVQFNEEVLPRGAAYLAYCAEQWLKRHGNKH